MLRSGLLLLVLALVLAATLWARDDTSTVLVVSNVVATTPPAPPPVSLTFNLPFPAPPADPDAAGPCPAPFTAGKPGDLDAPKGIEAITPSAHDVRLLAAWSSETVHVSTDEGRSFHPVLEHDGQIGDVVFDCRGRLHVLRGDGELGTYDPRSETERWTRVATFWSRPDKVDTGRLIPDGDGVAVIGSTRARRDRLWLVRRGKDGLWQAKHLFSDREPGYWSGIGTGSIRALPDGRIRMMANPDMNDFGVAECGYAKVFEVTFDLEASRIATRDLGEGGAQRDDRLQQDPAGRWLLVADGHASRLTTEELMDRLARPPAP